MSPSKARTEDPCWWRVNVQAPPETREAVGLILLDEGAGGLQEEEGGIAAYFLPERRDVVEGRLVAFASARDDPPQWRWEMVPPGWQDAWKAFFRPAQISPRLGICPSWEQWAPKDREVRVLRLDPGRAFGTGAHETTRMCLRLLDGILQAAAVQGPLLDVGCGSGILGIAAALLGVRRVFALDVDRLAVHATRDNARGNGVDDRISVVCGDLRTIRGTYPLAVANIVFEVLLGQAPLLAARVVAGGTLLLSGTLAPELDAASRAYQAQGFREYRREIDGEWGALVLRRLG